ncbi:MAG: hypothetical protein MZV65_14985 [Chromatiales bacterium]|nr:hypothetical protein [Chromatiales bacterium]
MPTATLAPAAGLWSRTMPAGTVSSYFWKVAPTLKPASRTNRGGGGLGQSYHVRDFDVAGRDRWRSRCGGPEDTVKIDGGAGGDLRAGCWILADDIACGDGGAGSQGHGARIQTDSDEIGFGACQGFGRLTLGTVTGWFPADTTRLTALPGATWTPPAGFWLMTLPAGMVALACVVTEDL